MVKVANIEELEHKKISKLIWQYALPSMIGTTVNAFYNIIDRFFIGRGPGLGDEAMNALGLALPIMIAITAFGMLFSSGAASRISIYMGRKEKDKAERIVGCAILLCVIITIIMIALMLIFLDPILLKIGATQKTFDYAKEFLTYYIPGSIFLTLCWCFNNMLRASGYPRKSMYTMLLSVFANIILAPLFIFGFKMGIKGAALATVCSMFISLCFVSTHFLNPNSLLRLRLIYIRLNMKIVGKILSIGLPSFLIQMASASVVLFIMYNLNKYGGDYEMGAFTIANTLITVMTMITQGMTQGTQPIIGYNYGAENYGRIREILKYTIKIGILIGCVGFVIGQVFPLLFAEIFHPTARLAAESAKGLHIITLFLPFFGFQIVATNFFLSIGKALESILLSLSRQFLILIPALFILAHFFKLKGVWYSMPIADFLATAVALILFLIQIKKFKKIEFEQQQRKAINEEN